MFRQLRSSTLGRAVAWVLVGALLWLSGPHQAAAATAARPGSSPRHARRLTLNEQRACRGGASGPGKVRGWQYSVPTLGGYGELNVITGNQNVAIPVVGYAGKGLPTQFTLYHNSASTTTSYMPTARPPVSNGWTHSYNLYLNGAGTSTVTVVEGDGSQNSFTQNMGGSFTAPAGDFDTLVQNVNSTYTLTRKSGLQVNFGSNNKLATLVDRNGNTVTVAYYTSGNGNGQISTITDASSRVLTLAYNTNNTLSSVTDPASRVFALTYDTNYNLQRVTYPAPATGVAQPYFEFATTSTQGTLTSFKNRLGSTWSLSYGGGGGDYQAPGTITDPNLNAFSYNESTRTVTLEDGNRYTATVDSSGNRTSVTLNSTLYYPSQTQSWTWDSQHNMLTRVTGRGNTWTNTYDTHGNTLTVTNPNSTRVANLAYNTLNLPTSSEDALSHVTSYGYDTAGNLTSVTDANSGVAYYQYGTTGLLTQQTDAKSHVTTYAYDTYGNMTSLTDPDSKVTSCTYNSLSQQTGRTDARSRATSYSYDGLGRLTTTDYPAGTDPTYTYNAEDQPLTFVDGTGTTTRTYDNLGRMLTEVKSSRTFTNTYDAVGRRTRLVDPDSRQFDYSYDNAGRLVSETLNSAAHAAYVYDADGNVTEQTNPNGSKAYQVWDTRGRLTSLTNKRSNATVLSSFSYTYNNDDQRTGVTEADSSTETYGYDVLHRLTSETRTGTYANTLSYVLDAVGNWTSRTVNGTTTSYTYDSADRITAAGTNSYTWNDDGSLASRTVGGTTTSFTWDYEAQLTALSSGPTFAYDAGGRRVSRTAGGTTTSVLHDGGAVLLEQQSGTTTANYTYGNALLSRSGETQHFDGLGSARTTTSSTEVINATGTYEAYGQSLGGTGSSATPYCYGGTSGYRNDGDAGLLHIGARWYDPSIGRWISADTDLGGIANPVERNRYLYCDGDPVDDTDPSGHAPSRSRHPNHPHSPPRGPVPVLPPIPYIPSPADDHSGRSPYILFPWSRDPYPSDGPPYIPPYIDPGTYHDLMPHSPQGRSV
jgi:RHS repeat-associated protein